MGRDRKGISISIEAVRGLLPDQEEELILNVPYTAGGRYSVLAMLARMEESMVLLEICDDKAGDGLLVRSIEIAGKRYNVYSCMGAGLGEGCNMQERMLLAYMLARGVKLGRLERELLCNLRINRYEIRENPDEENFQISDQSNNTDKAVTCGRLEMPQIMEGSGTDIGLELEQQHISVPVNKDISRPDKKTDPMGMRNRACILGAVEKGFEGKIHAGISSYYKVIPKRNLWLRLPGRGRPFGQILREHIKGHPLMQPQDYGKLCFQSEFGPEHMIRDEEQAITYLREEWKGISSSVESQFPESIGNGLCRFPLASCSSEADLELLGKLFILTAQECHGTMEGLMKKLEQAEEMIRIREKEQAKELMREWITDWKQKGCPPVHHSQVYRDKYDPHYRLLKKDYACFFPLLLKIQEIVMKGRSAVIAVDGRCGSGKTYFAELVGRLFLCNIFHMDDFYLPIDLRQEKWMEIPGGNMDFTRFQTEILNSVRSGKEVDYQTYSCRKESLGEETRVPFRKLTVVEGSYSHHPALEAGYDLKIFLTCSGEEQRRRLQEREKDYYKAFEERWIPLEENYFRCYNVEENSHLTVDTSGFFE